MISRMSHVLTILFLAIAVPVLAQVQTGSILVRTVESGL